MTFHYHGTPITPAAALDQMAGKMFCVRHARPDHVEKVHKIGQSVMLDNGAFSAFTRGAAVDWQAYYSWTDRWLDYPTTWAVIPDAIDAGAQLQDALIAEWPHGDRGAPVWHSGEPIDRLLRLADGWSRVCIGSTDDHWQVGGDVWSARMDEAFDAISKRHRRTPWLHLLRGLSQCGKRWPFASVDSSSVGQNHHRYRSPLFVGTPDEFATRAYSDKWDAVQCPAGWAARLGEAA